MEDADDPREDFAAYEKVASLSKRLVVTPGDQIPMKDIRVQILTAAREHPSAPLSGVGAANALFPSDPEPATGITQKPRLVGTLTPFETFAFELFGPRSKST